MTPVGSLTEYAASENCRLPATSLSVMVTVAVEGEPTLPGATPVMATVKLRAPSTIVVLVIGTSSVFVVSPALKVTLTLRAV